MPRAIGLAALLAILAGSAHAQGWVERAVGDYVGRDHNVGQLQCETVTFSLRGGALVGHYRIEDDPPFEGDLTNFVPQGEGTGLFTWTDRDGTGVRFIRFAHDFSSFFSLWGRTAPDPHETGYGLRGPDAVVPGCTAGPTS